MFSAHVLSLVPVILFYVQFSLAERSLVSVFHKSFRFTCKVINAWSTNYFKCLLYMLIVWRMLLVLWYYPVGQKTVLLSKCRQKKKFWKELKLKLIIPVCTCRSNLDLIILWMSINCRLSFLLRLYLMFESSLTKFVGMRQVTPWISLAHM